MYNYYEDTGCVTLPEGISAPELAVRENKTCMSMEYCSHGDLISCILDHGPIQDQKLVKHLMLQICQGLDAVHNTTEYAHLDIKPDNILIGDDFQLKLTDFGLARPITESISTLVGTEGYCAPEVLNARNKPYNGIQADIFSLGVLFFIM